MMKPKLSPKARPGNRNAAKPPDERLVPFSARIKPETDAALRRFAGRSPMRTVLEFAVQLMERAQVDLNAAAPPPRPRSKPKA